MIPSVLCLLSASAVLPTRLIAVDLFRNIIEIDPASGSSRQIGVVSSNAGIVGALAYDKRTQTVYLTSTSLDALFRLDPSTGTATRVGDFGDASIVMHGLEFDDANGQLYGMSADHEGKFYRVNTTDGRATQVNSHVGGGFYHNLAFDSMNNVMYMTAGGPPAMLYTINVNTGIKSPVGPLGALTTNPSGLAFEPVRRKLYLVDRDTNRLMVVNTSTG